MLFLYLKAPGSPPILASARDGELSGLTLVQRVNRSFLALRYSPNVGIRLRCQKYPLKMSVSFQVIQKKPIVTGAMSRFRHYPLVDESDTGFKAISVRDVSKAQNDRLKVSAIHCLNERTRSKNTMEKSS